jgi:hypothetical protein
MALSWAAGLGGRNLFLCNDRGMTFLPFLLPEGILPIDHHLKFPMIFKFLIIISSFFNSINFFHPVLSGPHHW